MKVLSGCLICMLCGRLLYFVALWDYRVCQVITVLSQWLVFDGSYDKGRILQSKPSEIT